MKKFLKSINKYSVLKLVREMIPIILGVLIALFINNWNQSRIDQKFQQTILSSINSELKENHDELLTLIPAHKQLLDTINQYQHDSTVNLGQILNKVNGIQLVSIKNTSWKALLNSNIQLVEYNLITQLIDIDEDKNYMNVLSEKLLDLVYEELETGKASSKQKLFILINDILVLEGDLAKSHESSLALIEEQ